MYILDMWVVDNGKIHSVRREFDNLPSALEYLEGAYKIFDQIMEIHWYRRVG